MLAPISTASILQMRQQILARQAAIAGPLGNPPAPGGSAPALPASAPAEQPRFGAALESALRSVSAIQDEAGNATTAFETGQTHDLASVMIARQKAAIAFEATLQARNRLIGAYKEVMSMPL